MIVRIIQSPRNKNGYILREVSTGQIGFITQFDKWDQIAQGQIWEAEKVSFGATFFRAKLLTQKQAQSQS